MSESQQQVVDELAQGAVTTAPERPPAKRHQPDHHDLVGRRSIIGAVVVVAVLSFFGFGLQAIDDAVRNSSGFTVGQTEQVSDTVAFTPASGWLNDPTQTEPGSGVVAKKNGWETKVAVGIVLQPGQTVEDFAKIFHDLPPNEAGSQVSDLTTFTTTSGLHGVTWEVHGPTSSSATWQIVNGDQVTQMLASGPSDTIDSVQTDLLQMAKSITMSTATEATT